MTTDDGPVEGFDLEAFWADYPPEFRAEMEAFMSRTKYDRLTVAILENLPDQSLEQAIVDYVIDRVPVERQMQAPTLDPLPRGLRAIWGTWCLESDVANGGFQQFFENNPSGRCAVEAIQGFRLFGLDKLASISERAVGSRRQIQTLRALDDEFYALDATISPARIRYIREHPHEFVTE